MLTPGVGCELAGASGRHQRNRYTDTTVGYCLIIRFLSLSSSLSSSLSLVLFPEYFDAKTQRYVDFPVTDVLQMMGRAGRPQYDHEGVAVIMVEMDKKNFYKKFIYEPFPVERYTVGSVALAL